LEYQQNVEENMLNSKY